MTTLPKFSTGFFHPRFWLIWSGIILMWLVVLLPYPLLQLIGRSVGRISMRLLKRRTSIVRRNLALCFPDMPIKEREALVRQNFESVGMGVIETGMAWFWPDWRVRKWFTITGYEHVEQARKEKRGLLLIGIHFLTLELGARIFGQLNPGVGVYRPNNNPLLDWLQTWGRLRSNKTMLNRYDLKGMVRALRNNEIIWYAPDHDYGLKNSVFAPFFAVKEAATTSGTYMLVRSAQPAVISFVPRRLPNSKGYELLILPEISNEIPLDDKTAAAARVNAAVEQAVLLAPEQYMWLHRRFKTRPEGVAPVY